MNQVLYSSHLLFLSLSVKDVEWMAKLILKTTCYKNKPHEFIRAPGFCLEVVAVASICLPHPLQPSGILLELLGRVRSGGEAGEESFEALAREKREEGGVEQVVAVFQRSQRIRAGEDIEAALWQ